MKPQDNVETVLRGPQSYPLAKRAVELMEEARVWPTPLNFEIWLHVAGEPEGELAVEIARILELGESITEATSEQLAEKYLPRQQLNQQIRDTGDLLSAELASVSDAIHAARKNQTQYGRTLATADAEMAKAEADPGAMRAVVGRLVEATRTAQDQNSSLAKRLSDSKAEVGRLREHLEQVRRDAATDALTNLANRKSFDEELAKAIAEAEAAGEALTLALLDIDHFKRFNDTWGHQTGDQVLRFVASVIGRAAAPPRFAARYGGEEFAMIFPGEEARQAQKTLEGLRKEIASRMLKRRSTNEDLGQITISGGFAAWSPGESGETLMERADEALYDSKRAGRNRTTKASLAHEEAA